MNQSTANARRKPKNFIRWLLAWLLLVMFIWPIRTNVSGCTRIKLLTENNSPMAGISVIQRWGVYGYGGSGGSESRISDSSGIAEFPARYSTAMLGMRAIRRSQAFVTQCFGILAFGSFASGFTDRWGPIVSIDINLPPGTWLPVAQPTAAQPSVYGVVGNPKDLIIMPDGPHRYIYVRNQSPLRPTAYISGDAIGFLADTEIVLRLKQI